MDSTAVLPVRLDRVVVGWQDTGGRQIMGVNPVVSGLIALTVSSSGSDSEMLVTVSSMTVPSPLELSGILSRDANH